MTVARAFLAFLVLATATALVVWWVAPDGAQRVQAPLAPEQTAWPAPGAGGLNDALTQPATGEPLFTGHSAGEVDLQADPLLVHGLRDTLEAWLMDAQLEGADDPASVKQRLAALVGRHFPAALATRALALAERYVDYRVALGELRPPADQTDPGALREALAARHSVRQQFFDSAENDALFAREADLDRYTLARLEIARNVEMTAPQREQALRVAESELAPARRLERAAATEHVNAAAQTADFNARNTDERTRHTARSAQYGDAAAHAMAQLDREEQHWNQRLDQYSQAQAQLGKSDSTASQQLRQQLFSVEEQQRIDAALALRTLQAARAGS